ncbi:hypothetical protein H1Z61_11740 [Bacillus aquiflavi]|uniref:Uncharacterized protein n=1 Tax=Bacillus aquiflavi TaxID=2672567 RepID=A0A6B3VUU8_9BACI|nr:hypothetical protein [Bacillus aquiflavi]MBA4537784.1 hypothetical protein [Bacillus aquiflavi]NEY82040.1 hypothetical protein [Bacillus aquiflavi]
MRFLNRRSLKNQLDQALDDIQDVMVSELFIYIDLLFYALFFTLLLSTSKSISFSPVKVFFIIYLLSVLLFLLIKKWFKDYHLK